MVKLPGRQECKASTMAEEFANAAVPVSNECCCEALMRRLEADRVREVAEAARQWDRAFGAAAPADRKLTGERIIHTASRFEPSSLSLTNAPDQGAHDA